MVKCKKILIFLAFLVCGHFMIATKNAYAMGSFDGYLKSAYYQPKFDFTHNITCGSYTPNWFTQTYMNTHGVNWNAYCFYAARRGGDENFHLKKGDIIAVSIAGGSGYASDQTTQNVDTNLINQHNFLNVIGIDSENNFESSNYTVYLYADKNYDGIIKFAWGYTIEPGGTLAITNISVFNTTAQLQDITNLSLDEIKEILLEIRDNNAGQQMEQDKQEQQEQGQASQDTQEQTESSVDGSTQNLLSVIGNFFGAFTNARPSNCNFNWGLNEYGFGTINMCQTQIPSEFRTIFNILTIIIIIPMIMWLISSIINAFKEFQQ